MPNPCRNSGICKNLNGSYECTCAQGWTGNNCGTDVNECASAPCKNGGSCINTQGSFICYCTGGWSGVTCEYGKLDILIDLCNDLTFQLIRLRFKFINSCRAFCCNCILNGIGRLTNTPINYSNLMDVVIPTWSLFR